MLSNGKSYSALQMINFAFEFFNLKYKNYVLFNKKSRFIYYNNLDYDLYFRFSFIN